MDQKNANGLLICYTTWEKVVNTMLSASGDMAVQGSVVPDAVPGLECAGMTDLLMRVIIEIHAQRRIPVGIHGAPSPSPL